MAEKVSVPDIVKQKRRGEKITCLTAYDYSFARILDAAGVDILLVGDSVGCVFQGQPQYLAGDYRRDDLSHSGRCAREQARLGGGRYAVSLLSGEQGTGDYRMPDGFCKRPAPRR